MTHVKLDVTPRTITGSEVRKLRRVGIVPAVIYSKTVNPIIIELPKKIMIAAFNQAGKTSVIDVSIDKKMIPCIIHDLDIHPVTGNLLHVDFLAVNLKEKTTADVPLNFTNEAPGIKEFSAVLNTPVKVVEVEALPDNIPESIEVDISSLVALDSVITIQDLVKLSPSTFVILDDHDTVVASLTSQTAEVEEPVEIIESIADGEPTKSKE